MVVDLNFGKEVDSAYVTVIGPDGYYDVTGLDVSNPENEEQHPTVEEEEGHLFLVENDSLSTFIIVNHHSDLDDDYHHTTTMNPGQYNVIISYKEALAVDSTEINVHHFYPNSFGSLTAEEQANGSIDLDLEYWAHYPDSTDIHLYMNTSDSSYNGVLFGVVEFGEADEEGYGSMEVNYVPDHIPHGDSVHFYLVMHDSTNIPFHSEITDHITYQAPIYGQVYTNESDTLDHHWKVYIDLNNNGIHDKDAQGEFEPSTIANKEGYYYFDILEPDSTYTINVLVPRRYMQASTTPNALPYQCNYTGTSTEVNFQLEANN